MSRSTCIFVLLFIVISIFLARPARAEWTADGIVVCDDSGSKRDTQAARGTGNNVFVAWEDEYFSPARIYAQKISPDGDLLWNTAGVAVSNDALGGRYQKIIADGTGGCIVAWVVQTAATNKHVYAQRIDTDGNVLWGSTGIRICTADTDQGEVQLVSDGHYGAIFFWNSTSTSTTTALDIYAQRINSSGSRLWIGTGVPICMQPYNQSFITAVADGFDGAIVAWQDYREGGLSEIYGQRISATGVTLWASGGLEVDSYGAYDYRFPDLIADGQGGAWFISSLDPGSLYYVAHTRVLSTGAIDWSISGSVCDHTSGQALNESIPDGAGGFIVSWWDTRGDGTVYAQRVSERGYFLWQDNGVQVFADSTGSMYHEIVPDGSGGAILAFRKNDSYQMIGQRIDRLGNLRWAPDGVNFTETSAGMQWTAATSTSDNGITLFFSVSNGTDYDLYAQRLDQFGQWGFPSPGLIEARDVPGDQGGNVLLTWMSSYLDAEPYVDIDHYSVWRMLDEVEATPYLSGTKKTVELPEISLSSGPAVRILEGAAGASAWEWLEDLDAIARHEYSYSAATHNDSTSTDPCLHQFQIVAHRADPTVYWLSDPISGYSVDNLAPSVILGISGAQQESPDGIRIDWDPNSESDFSYYNVYRNNGTDFQPGPSNLIGTTTSEYIADETWTPISNAFYRVAAVDIHGNTGLSALLQPEDVILETMLQTYEAALDDDRIVLSWTLSEAGESMEFHLMRAVGAQGEFGHMEDAVITCKGLLFTFTDAETEPGLVYRYRLNVTDEDGTKTLFESDLIGIPAKELTLHQNHPNPFNPSTTINFYLPYKCHVRIDVFDIAGRRVSTLIDRDETSGRKSIRWNGIDSDGDHVSSGVYFCRLTAGKKTLNKKMILLR